MFGKQPDDGFVRLALDGRLTDVDGQLTIDRGLDERPLAAAGFHPHGDDVNYPLFHDPRLERVEHRDALR